MDFGVEFYLFDPDCDVLKVTEYKELGAFIVTYLDTNTLKEVVLKYTTVMHYKRDLVNITSHETKEKALRCHLKYVTRVNWMRDIPFDRLPLYVNHRDEMICKIVKHRLGS